jgi:hypothetical protein
MDELDLRCFCKRCEDRTKKIYKLSVNCINCGWNGQVIIRKGDKPGLQTECPNCGCTFVLSYGHDPKFGGLNDIQNQKR